MVSALAPFVPGLAYDKIVKWTPLIGAKIVKESAKHFPQATWAFYTSNKDWVQSAFYLMSGMGAGPFTKAMRLALSWLHKTSPNFEYFIAPGNAHSQSNTKAFYTTQTNGLFLYQWYTRIIDGSKKSLAMIDFAKQTGEKQKKTKGENPVKKT